MIDIFMCILVIAMAVILLIVGIYILAYYCSEDDSEFGTSTICKIAAILGMMIGWGQILLLPLDVSNTRLEDGKFRMDIIYQILYIVIGCFIFFILPLLISVYECDPEWTTCEKFKNSICFFIAEIVVIALIFGISYLFFHTAHVPLKSIQCKYNGVDSKYSSDYIISDDDTLEECEENDDAELEIRVSFTIYCIGLLSFLSYILFSVFGGIGLGALPLDLIYSYCSRPIKINERKLNELKKEIVDTAIDLKELGLKI